jgi:hypothetical protein
VEYKEDKGSKKIYDEFESILILGLKRTRENCEDRYGFICKMAKKYLRSYVGSIFLVKGA